MVIYTVLDVLQIEPVNVARSEQQASQNCLIAVCP